MSSKLVQVFAECESGRMTVSAVVYYGSDMLKVTGHHYHGQVWVKYDYSECPEISISSFERLVSQSGMIMDRRPTKQGMTHNYHLAKMRTANPEYGRFSSGSVSAEAKERIDQDKRLEELDAVLTIFGV